MNYEKAFALLGADYLLMRQCGAHKAIQRYRNAIAALAGIGILTFCSVYYAMSVLFHSLIIEWCLGTYITLLFLLMYVLLINTFTKTAAGKGTSFTLSNISRVSFVLFMAFVLSKPVEVYVLSSYHEADIIRYKASLVHNFSKQVTNIHLPDIQRLERRLEQERQQYLLYPTANSSAAIQSLQQRIAAINQGNEEAISKAAAKIDQSAYMLQRMALASSNVIAWLVCLLVMCLFLLPGYLIYSLPADDPYLAAKRAQERSNIEREFKNFLSEYHRIFSTRGFAQIRYSTPFADAPFNTIRKAQRTYASNNSFLDKYGPL
jgi:ABC-type multidrug transport system fused ATPase/permease subunit